MNKNTFFETLKVRLAGIPEKELQQAIDYYDEIISDKVEDGISEQDAIESLGSIDEIVKSILSDIPIKKLVKEKFGLKYGSPASNSFFHLLRNRSASSL